MCFYSQFKPLHDFCDAHGLTVRATQGDSCQHAGHYYTLQASQCTVHHKGKQVDVQSPYRFLNLHSGAELVVVPNKGVQQRPSQASVLASLTPYAQEGMMTLKALSE